MTAGSVERIRDNVISTIRHYESEAFHNGVQHVLSIVLEHTVVEMSGK